MIKGMKKGLAIAAIAAMTAGCFTGCGSRVNSEDVAAIVNSEEVPMGVASIYARYNQAQMYSTYSSYLAYMGSGQLFGQVLSEDSDQTYGEQMKDELMDYIVNMYIVRSHAGDYDITLTDDELAALDEVAKEFVAANDADVLSKIGTTEEHVKEMMALYTYTEKVYEKVIEDVDTEVSDEEAKQSKLTYITISLEGTETDDDGNVIDLTEAEVAEKEEMAQNILDEIKAEEDVANADMTSIAAEYDETLTANAYTYDDDDSYLDTVIFDAVEGLEDGELVDEVILSTDGDALYIVRFDAELDRDATDYQKENIVKQRQQDKYEEVLEGWKEESTYETTDAWKKFSIDDKDVYTFVEEETDSEE